MRGVGEKSEGKVRGGRSKVRVQSEREEVKSEGNVRREG